MTIVTGEKLQEKLQEAVCCRFCQGSVEHLENVSSKVGLAQLGLSGAKMKTARRK